MEIGTVFVGGSLGYFKEYGVIPGVAGHNNSGQNDRAVTEWAKARGYGDGQRLIVKCSSRSLVTYTVRTGEVVVERNR